MRAWLLVALSCLACVTAEDELDAANGTLSTDPFLSPDERTLASLVLLEVRKAVGGVLSPRGRDLNVLRFLLDDHEPLINIAKWELQMNGEVYTFMDDDPLQTQLEFGAELTHTKQIIILAKNKEAILGALVEDIEIKDMGSRVARVGNPYDPRMSSMRVATGALDEVQVGDQVCSKEKSPCYYLRTQLPEEVPRCLNLSHTNSSRGSVRYCDDSITSFNEIPEGVAVSVEGGNLMVTANFSRAPSKVEVVAFDLEDPTETVSPEGFECQVKGQPRQLAHECHQQLTHTVDLSHLEVLVVGLDKDGLVLESKMQAYEGIVAEKSNKGVIVGCVIGVLCAIALIAGIFVYIKGKKEKRGASASARASKYERTSTTEPPAQEEEA